MPIDLSLLAVLALGVAYAALPGVVNTEAFRRGMRSGFASALSIQAGALLGDALWAIVALRGAMFLLQSDYLGLALGIAGAGFLFQLARTALLSALRGAPAPVSQPRTGGGLLTGAVFSLANPAGLAFWTGIGGGMLSTGDTPTIDRTLVFLLAFSAGALCWGIGMSALVAWGRRFATPRLFRVIDGVCGLLLSFFGLRLLWSTVQRYGRCLALIPRALC
jgi:threonine/homoserine/homoserine lactone efflux protein